MASKKRPVPEINAGSMADIAFLLLIFFLVTTTMDVDKGLLVKLPPWTEESSEEQDIKEKNIFVVLVNAQDQLLIEEEYATLEDVRRLAKEFIDNNGDGRRNYDELSESDVELINEVDPQFISEAEPVKIGG